VVGAAGDRSTGGRIVSGLGPLLTLLALVALVLLVAVAVRWLLVMTTVHDYERALHFRRGRFTGCSTPGRTSRCGG
jgi:hypothetical protein